MAQRKALSKKVRFEVFKRDSFACQYCGRAAPDVVLQVDHISPVAKGGGNDLLNLVTSCADCNGGKGARSLDDQSVLAKQRAHLAELNERREQLALMVKWREALTELGEDEARAAAGHFERLSGGEVEVNETGTATLTRLIRKHGLKVVLDSIETAIDRHESPHIAFQKLPSICSYKALPPQVQEQKYIFGILRNRVDLSDPALAAEVVESIKSITDLLGADGPRTFAKTVDDLDDWWNYVCEQEYLTAKEQGYA